MMQILITYAEADQASIAVGAAIRGSGGVIPSTPAAHAGRNSRTTFTIIGGP
jgi:hypothetical protein